MAKFMGGGEKAPLDRNQLPIVDDHGRPPVRLGHRQAEETARGYRERQNLDSGLRQKAAEVGYGLVASEAEAFPAPPGDFDDPLVLEGFPHIAKRKGDAAPEP